MVGAYVALVMRVCALLCVSNTFSNKGVNKSVLKAKDVNVLGLCFSGSEFLGSYSDSIFQFSFIFFSPIKCILFFLLLDMFLQILHHRSGVVLDYNI